jgi:hypothetical protein
LAELLAYPRTIAKACDFREADRNFKGPFYTLGHVRYRLKRGTGVLDGRLGSVGGLWKNAAQIVLGLFVRARPELLHNKKIAQAQRPASPNPLRRYPSRKLLGRN